MNQTTTTEEITKAGPSCPDCGSATLLYCHPGKYAGIWECQNPACGVSDSCEHQDTETEQVESWPTGPEDMTYTSNVEICTACGVQVEA